MPTPPSARKLSLANEAADAVTNRMNEALQKIQESIPEFGAALSGYGALGEASPERAAVLYDALRAALRQFELSYQE